MGYEMWDVRCEMLGESFYQPPWMFHHPVILLDFLLVRIEDRQRKR